MTTFTAETLPAGYAIVCGVAVHVAALRHRYASDVRRFLKYAPWAEKLMKYEPHSPEWIAVVESCDCIPSRGLTQADLGNFLEYCSGELLAELAQRGKGAAQ